MLLNCHMAAFCTVNLDFRKQPNNAFVCKAIFATVYYADS